MVIEFLDKNQNVMYFAIVNSISEEITPKSEMINSTSDEINSFLERKTYGPGLEKLYVGFICVNPVFDQFFQPRSKYTKSKKNFEYSLKEDFETFVKLDEADSRRAIVKGIIDSIDSAIEENGVKDFDSEAYKNDLFEFFKNKKWLK